MKEVFMKYAGVVVFLIMMTLAYCFAIPYVLTSQFWVSTFVLVFMVLTIPITFSAIYNLVEDVKSKLGGKE